MKDVRCSGCRKRIGVGNGSSTTGKIWCTDFGCTDLPPAMSHQARDDYIRLVHAGGGTVAELAASFGLSNARVHQILAA
jgi:hypothetical protein